MVRTGTRVAEPAAPVADVLGARLREKRLSVQNLTLGLINPARYCEQASQRLDELNTRLARAATASVEQRQAHLGGVANRLDLQRPDRLLKGLMKGRCCAKTLAAGASRWATRAAHGCIRCMLESLSPLPTLAGHDIERSRRIRHRP